MTLNESLRFDDADASVKRAFLRAPDKVRIAARTKLYKWTSQPHLVADKDGRITPWWSFVESTQLPSGATAEGFRVAEERARRIGRTHREFGRARAAISDRFDNSMSDLLVVVLNEAVWGFAGPASGQPQFKDDQADLRHVFLIGGAWQVWIPNLTPRHVTTLPIRG